MLIFNLSRALDKVNGEKVLFKVRSPIKTPSMPHSRLGQSITLTGYSNGLVYFKLSLSL